ncbi:MAG TPA: DUF4157 domain-containing protein [Candidatus Thiothrix moscowensis]|uniref:eCIS core domain-containing protein n=1 Tax=Thiothrix sp. UBA2016 TaxID=1947695 RepID=UPI0025CE2ED6|nr:DUF4157 domain-containing protein [Thiothrix sp. UBA2016]HRJ53115.1 DUF4157 domain-containing protein [Candidatus Thiothrix moscowensis]HRJ93106.1 DUF4157 domain-containing protein [Candidatus Thiothrix moscowensis]
MTRQLTAQPLQQNQTDWMPINGGILQRTCPSCGNHTMVGGECSECGKNKKWKGLQAKLTIGEPDDVYEREADRVADQVMAMQTPVAPRSSPLQIQRFTGHSGGEGMDVPPSVARVLASPGRPLEPAIRTDMEQRFGHDFAGVKVHTGASAAQSARDVNALAYTVGNNLVFADGQFAPQAQGGRRLLTHELAHVVQQSNLVSVGNTQPIIMRSAVFNSTMEICHGLLKSRTFHVSQGGIRVTANASNERRGEPECSSADYNMTLTQKGFILNDEYGTCQFPQGQPFSRQWTNLSSGDYYLTIWTNNTNPYCCLVGDLIVEEQSGLQGASCTRPPPGALEILHTALQLAGLIPALGVIPDAVDAALYSIEGDWTAAGISTAAMAPFLGEGVTFTRLSVKVSKESIERLGREGVERRIRDAVQRAGTRVLRKAPPERIIIAMRNFRSRMFRVGAETFQLDSRGMQHILERHHPRYWDGTVKETQSFINENLSIDDVADAIQSIMNQNRDELLRIGTTRAGQITGQWNGIRYVLGVNQGRVGQFYPL